MRLSLRILAFVAALLLPLAAHAAEVELSGIVLHSESRWTVDGNLVTESVLQTPAGDEVVVGQLGGSADGFGQLILHGPRLLVAGESVTVRAHASGRRGATPTLTLTEVLSATDTAKFVRTTTDKGEPLRWKAGCVYIAYHPEGTAAIAGDAEFAILDQVFRTWQQAISSCSYLEFVLEGPREAEPGFDGINLIRFRDTKWCRPANDDAEERCYAPMAAALTILTFIDDPDSDRNGEIVDADIELNGVDFAISTDGSSEASEPCLADLANTLTHEVGHLIGLDHTCHDQAGAAPLDGNGNVVPLCTRRTPPPAISEPTMYNFQECGETKKITLEPDDIAGACAIYPKTGEAPECKRAELETGGCCSVSNQSPFGPLVLSLSVLALLALPRRRRSGAERAA